MTSAGLTIAEVAERTGLTQHTLRYYERDRLSTASAGLAPGSVAARNATSAGSS